ncbi:hypothetical protein FRC02_010954 [Tulasnella sp. 418]|nr:hypothetical protein FRC02_010954 [Tulasnella sp. 418]
MRYTSLLPLVFTFLNIVSAAPPINAKTAAALPVCPNRSTGQYDYIVAGAGAGGGPIAARLALKGYKVLLIDAGHDHDNFNTSIPLYLARASEDPQIQLDYYVKHYPPGDSNQDLTWYPRSTGIGGCTVHNALINVIPHKWDFNQIQSMFNDNSWSWDNMANYFTKIENIHYDLDPLPLDISLPFMTVPGVLKTFGDLLSGLLPGLSLPGLLPGFFLPGTNLLSGARHGYKGWLHTRLPPLVDPQLTAAYGACLAENPVKGLMDWNDWENDEVSGGGFVSMTKGLDGKRSSVRDHILKTRSDKPSRLFIQPDTFVTKILNCREADGSIRAYGVETVIAPNGKSMLPGSPRFGGKFTNATVTTFTAKNEIILSAGPFQSPQLLMNQGRQNLYSAGAAIYAWSHKSNPALPYRDIFSFWTPAYFKNFHKGWGQETASDHRAFINVIIKAHTKSRGWVRLTGGHPQDTLEINKNQFNTPESLDDLYVVRDEMKKSREFAQYSLFNGTLDKEIFPGPDVTTDAQLEEFIKTNQWGHHACCTAKIGVESDPMAVVNNNFQVYGVKSLRVLDNSVWPNIPGMFPTTPIYMISEKGADVVHAYAQSQGWTPTP